MKLYYFFELIIGILGICIVYFLGDPYGYIPMICMGILAGIYNIFLKKYEEDKKNRNKKVQINGFVALTFGLAFGIFFYFQKSEPLKSGIDISSGLWLVLATYVVFMAHGLLTLITLQKLEKK